HFWMSGMAALAAAATTDTPVAQTFHALGIVKRRYQGDKDTSPPERLATERRIVRAAAHIVATCTDEAFELMRLGADRERLTVVPWGVDLELFHPDGPDAAACAACCASAASWSVRAWATPSSRWPTCRARSS